MADLHDGRDVGGGGGLDDAEGAVIGEDGVRGPFGAGVRGQVCFGGGDVVVADYSAEVGPCGLEVGRGGVVLGRLRGGEGLS